LAQEKKIPSSKVVGTFRRKEETVKSLYRVAWVIDIEAKNHKEAAEIALEIQRDPLSAATQFDVTERESGIYYSIILPCAGEKP